MKKLLENLVRRQAARYLRRYISHTVVVVGSIGKTSTTQAIASVLSDNFSIVQTRKNYNTQLGVSFSLFERDLPGSLYNPLSWLLVLIKNEVNIIRGKKTDLAVLELGTDNPGDIAAFSWLKPDLAVVTAVAPEHMEKFKTIESVAREELSAIGFSKHTLVNSHMVEERFLKSIDTSNITLFDLADFLSLGISKNQLQVAGDHSLETVAAAVATARYLGIKDEEIKKSVKHIQPQPGRMSVLLGQSDTTLIDDTYNSSPEAAKAALNYLYGLTGTTQRIALLGNMNELGDMSATAHEELGRQCDPKKLDILVTLGKDANKYTAEQARKNGCIVFTAQTPYEAAKIIEDNLKKGAAVLFKGSQNGVFAEEAIKPFLLNSHDKEKLVRQSRFWLDKKQASFEDFRK